MNNINKILRLTLYVVIVSCVVVIIPQDAMAQMQRLYTTQNGLATSDIRDISEDSRGMAWISGVSSIQVFDGYNFYNMPMNKKDSDREICSVVYGIKELETNRMMVMTSNGLYIYDRKQRCYDMIHLDENEDIDNGYPINTAIELKQKGKILILTGGYSVYILDRETMKVNQAETDRYRTLIKGRFFTTAYMDRSGCIWINNYSKELYHYDIETFSERKFTISDEAEEILKRCAVNCICETNDGKVLFGTNEGILCYTEESGELIGHISVMECSRQLNAPVVALQLVDDGRVFIGTDSRGLWVSEQTNDGGFSIKRYELEHQMLNLDYAKVKHIHKDADGNLLVGLLQKGVLVIPPKSDKFRYYAITPRNDDINASCVTSMAKDENGNCWVATDGCGVFRASSGNLSAAVPVNTGLKSLLVQSVVIDRRQAVWVGTFGYGVQVCEDGCTFHCPDWLSSLSAEPIMAMAYDNKNDVLYIGTNGKGVFAADLTNKTISAIKDEVVQNTWISALCFGCDGYLWLGTASGLYFMNTANGRFGELKYTESRISTIQMISDTNEKLLVATDNGLVIYDKKTKKPTYLFEGEHIMAAGQTENCYWLTTARSIVCLEKKNLSHTRHNSLGGFSIGEFHKASMLHLEKDNILFGGDNGIIGFTPTEVRMNSKITRQLVFIRMKLNDGETNIFEDNGMELDYEHNSFIIKFSVPNFSDPQSIRYEYMLEGYDEHWQICQGSPQAYYSSLPSGNYHFKVRAFYESNTDEFVEKTISVKIRPPFLNSGWAWCIYIITLGAIVYFVYRLLSYRRRQHKLLLQTRESEKRKEEKLRLFTSIIHELRSPVTMIVSPLKQLMATTDDEGTLSLYQVMKRNCDRLLDIVKQITDIRTIDSGQFKLQMEEVDFVPYLNEICSTFTAMATVKQISFTVEYSKESIMTYIDPKNFEKVVTNLLSNAFKFTPEGGVIKVRVNGSEATGNGSLEVRVFNNGEHISDEDIPHMFERFYQGNNRQVSEQDTRTGSGIGLNLVYELVQLHHGTVRCSNVEPQGVEFIVSVPIANALLASTSSLLSSDGIKKTILVVDDDTELCNYVFEQLKKDFNVVMAFSGNKAWEYVLQYRPDVVVTDIRMPDGDGIELCQRIKSNPETDTTSIIMLTGEASEEAQMRSFELQVDHFIGKPFNMLILKSAIVQVIKTRQNMLGRITRTNIGYNLEEVSPMDSADEKLFDKIKKSIIAHLDDSEFGVEELAQEVGLSRVHLNRKLKEKFSTSPNNYIKTFRMKHAAYLLVNNKVNISEVAYKVGFSSHSYFSSSFHDYFGMTPKEFVAQYSDNIDDETLKKLLE